MKSIWIGFDPREADAFAVAKHSARRMTRSPIPVNGVVLPQLTAAGLYRRETLVERGIDGRNQMHDVVSGAPMSTQFAISRFFVPMLAQHGWALFMDCDMLVRTDLARLFEQVSSQKAVMCVHHDHQPANATKMDGQRQTSYPRKNWSSVMLFNCDHEANRPLFDLDYLNTTPGRDLHAFSWLKDDDLIGAVGPEWNWLAGHSPDSIDPSIVHFTDGVPSMAGYEDSPYAEEWRQALIDWAGVPPYALLA